jgi:hypothetical protein
VFQSGKVKLQIGGVLLDVHSGTPLQTRQDVAALNVRDGYCVLLGDLMTRMVLCPDVMQLINDTAVPEYKLAPAAGAGGRLAGKGAGQGEEGARAGSGDEDMEDGSEEDGEEGEGEEGGSEEGGDSSDEEVGKRRKKVGKKVQLQEDEEEDEEMEDADE